jgi:hypothetical protein
MTFGTGSCYFPAQRQQTYHCNGEALCFLLGSTTEWTFKYYLEELSKSKK